MADVKGSWSGLMFDAEGHRARLEADLEVRNEEIAGKLRFTMIETHEAKLRSGEVAGRVRGDAVELRYDVPGDRGRITVHFTGKAMPVTTHAKAALYGTYTVQGDSDKTLTAGVVILWQYASPLPR